jgi:superfamily II DNA/RNA helicase
MIKCSHRVGRTGRAGNKGSAYAIIGPQEIKFATIVHTSMKQANQMIPPQLEEMVSQRKYVLDRGGGQHHRKKHKGPVQTGAPEFHAARK